MVNGLQIGRRTLTRNSLYNLLGLGLPLMVALAVVPVLLRGLGETGFGVLGLVWMFITLFGDLGFGRAATRFAADALGAGEVGRVPGVARVVLRAQAGLGVLAGAALALVAGPLVRRVLAMDPAFVPDAERAFLYLALGLPALTVAAAFRGLLEAAQRFGALNAVRAVMNTLNYLLPVAALAAGWSVSAIVGLLMVLRVVMMVAMAYLAADLWRGGGEVAEAGASTGEILGFGAWITVSSVVSPILVYLDRFLLGALVSVAAVGVYTAPYEVVTRLLLVPGSIAATLFPAISTLAASGRAGQLARVQRGSSLAILAVVGPLAFIFAYFAEPLLDVWLGAGASPGAVDALRFLAPGVVLNALAHVPLSVVQGLGRADVTGRIHLMELPIHVPLAWFLIARWGVAGAAAAWSIRATLDAVLLTLAARALRPAPTRAAA